MARLWSLVGLCSKDPGFKDSGFKDPSFKDVGFKDRVFKDSGFKEQGRITLTVVTYISNH